MAVSRDSGLSAVINRQNGLTVAVRNGLSVAADSEQSKGSQQEDKRNICSMKEEEVFESVS